MSRRSPLTERQIAEVRRVFDKFDEDGNGRLSRKEFKKALNNVRFKTADAELLMLQADTDHSGEITFEEFLDAVTYKTNANGVSTDDFNALVRLVAAVHVSSSDQKSLVKLEKFSFWPPPVFHIIVSIIQISVFAHYVRQECDEDNASLECPLSFHTPISFRPGCREEAYRFLTYVFVHSGWGHLLFNIVIQLLIGIPLEMTHGMLRVGILYFVGGLAGSLGSSVFDMMANVVGASGAVYAILGAHVANVIQNFNQMPFKWIRLALLVILITLDFTLSIYQRYVNNSTKGKISYTGHISGFSMGLLLGSFVLRNLWVEWYEKYIRYTGLTIAIVGVTFAIFWNIFNDYDGAEPC